MLETLVVDLLMAGTLLMMAGWVSDTLARLAKPGRSSDEAWSASAR